MCTMYSWTVFLCIHGRCFVYSWTVFCVFVDGVLCIHARSGDGCCGNGGGEGQHRPPSATRADPSDVNMQAREDSEQHACHHVYVCVCARVLYMGVWCLEGKTSA